MTDEKHDLQAAIAKCQNDFVAGSKDVVAALVDRRKTSLQTYRLVELAAHLIRLTPTNSTPIWLTEFAREAEQLKNQPGPSDVAIANFVVSRLPEIQEPI